MARLQSSLLLKRNHGNASKADPDAVAPYPEFQQLLLSADTTVKHKLKKRKKKRKMQKEEKKRELAGSNALQE